MLNFRRLFDIVCQSVPVRIKKDPGLIKDRGTFISACLFISEESYMKKMKRKIYHLGVLGKWLVPVQTEHQIMLGMH